MTAPRRIAMIGLDAASLDFIRKSSDELPNLRRVLAGGSLHRIQSSADLLTGSVWPTFATASHPGEHGIYHHLQWDQRSMRLRRIHESWLPWTPFWHDLARAGRRVIEIDVPLAFRAGPEEAVAILNWGAHDSLSSFRCRPRTLEGEIRRRFGMHPMGIEVPVGKSHHEIARIRDDVVRGARTKGQLVRWALENVPWDFCIAVFGETHRGGHILWPEGPHSEVVPGGALLDLYRAVDEGLGTILESPALDGAGLVVFAVHGMGPNRSQVHFASQVIARANASFAGDGAPSATAKAGGPAKAGGIVAQLRQKVPPAIQNRIARMVPVAVRDEVVNRTTVGGIDWAKTPGFVLASDLHAYLRLNRRGRERYGSLEADSATETRYLAWVRDCFESLRIASTGEPLVSGFHFVRDTYPGARDGQLPDVVVTWTGCEPAERIESDRVGSITAALGTGRSGNHEPEGFCVLSLPGMDAAAPEDGRGLATLVRRALA